MWGAQPGEDPITGKRRVAGNRMATRNTQLYRAWHPSLRFYRVNAADGTLAYKDNSCIYTWKP